MFGKMFFNFINSSERNGRIRTENAVIMRRYDWMVPFQMFIQFGGTRERSLAHFTVLVKVLFEMESGKCDIFISLKQYFPLFLLKSWAYYLVSQ
jgi:hypothetical protein